MSLKVAAVFSDHMVLQRNKDICFFGTSDSKRKVSVSIERNGKILCENSTSVFFDRGAMKNKWEVYLPPLQAMDDLKVTVTDKEESISFSDVATGEVWLAGGQSNMEFELQNCSEGPDELKIEKAPNVRFYYTQKNGWIDQSFYDAEKNTCWQTWQSEWKKSWSAVGYFFAKKLAAELGVTVGVIGCNWGGTSASAWMSESRMEKDSDLKTYLDEYAEAEKGKSVEIQCKEYDDYLIENDKWQEKCNAIYSANPNAEWSDVLKELGPCPWPGPKCCKNPYRPSGLYHTMLERLMPYSLRGFIFYQGESDDHKPYSYFKLLREMIDQWRCDWNDEELPFINVQLPEHRYRADKDYKNWPIIREAQLKIFQTTKNTGLCVGADLGQYNDIHPKAKEEMGRRLALQALSNVYEKLPAEKANGPLFKKAFVKESRIYLFFDYADDGFTLKDDDKALEEYRQMEKVQGNLLPEDFNGFEIAGQDKIFYPANFAFGTKEEGLNIIILSSEKVSHPLYARYAWFNYGPVILFGKNGLPASPFRSRKDDESFANSEHADIQQIMEV